MHHNCHCRAGANGVEQKTGFRGEKPKDEGCCVAGEQNFKTSTRCNGALGPAWKRHRQEADQKDRNEDHQQLSKMSTWIAGTRCHGSDG
jgi:hypothetical protein